MRCLKSGKEKQFGGPASRRDGFTLIELVAVVAIILVLVSLLSAALDHTKEKALRVSCLSNMKQLQAAWMLYVQDNDSFFPLNQTAPSPDDPRFLVMESSKHSWVTGNPLTDLTTAGIEKGTLFQYVRSVDIYRCPMDSSTVYKHPDVPRTRSYAMSAYLGGDEGDKRVKYRESELRNPANTFVFIEEHESSLWAANFMVLPRERLLISDSANWVSTPSDRHYQGCNLTFADGHAEYWRWYSPKEANMHHKLTSRGRELRDIRRLQACVPQVSE